MAIAACSGHFDFDADLPDAALGVDAPFRVPDVGSPDARAGRVACASNPCTLPEHGCCITTRSFCIDVGEVACRGMLVNCDGTSDCPSGKSCCATVVDAGVMSVECKDTCTAPQQITLCDPTDPSECGDCRAASAPLPQEYFRCY